MSKTKADNLTEEDLENNYYEGYVIGYDYSKIQGITENLKDLKDFYKTCIKALFTYPKTTENELEYTYHISGEALTLIKKIFRKRILQKHRKERSKAFISYKNTKEGVKL